jgi:hypothetical protein
VVNVITGTARSLRINVGVGGGIAGNGAWESSAPLQQRL